MTIALEFDAATYAQQQRITPPACDGVLVEHENPGRALGAVIRSDPLGEGWRLAEDLPGERVVLWSGSLAGDLFESDPRSWMPAGREALDALCARIALGLAETGRRICFHPHSRHVLNDPPSCMTFLEDHRGEPFDIAVAPASLIEPGMLADLDDHLERIFQFLGPVCSLCYLCDVELAPDGSRCEAVPLGSGRISRKHLHDLVNRYLPPDIPRVLRPVDVDQQLRWLGS